MAALTSGNSLPDDRDYSQSHRPVPSIDYNTTRAQRAPSFGTEPGKPRREQAQQQAGTSAESASGSAGHTRKRGNSFSSLLHRSTSASSSLHGKNGGSVTTPADAPPLPATRIAQAQAEAAQSRSFHAQPQEAAYRVNGPGFDYGYGYHSSVTGGYEQEHTTPHSYSNNVVVGENGNKMLRKSSKARQAEQERMEALARQAQAPRQPPRLPSINDFQGGSDQRPDSFQIFSNQYNTPSSTTSNSTAPAVQQATTANFSRPGQIYNMPSSNNSSSSPAYALRTGNAFAQQASASPLSQVGAGQKTASNGEYVTDRGESMAHRGRYSYASSMAPVNAVNSPRRVRRRKDPTPFNILVVGARNSGKTSFISFLRHSLALPVNQQQYNTSTTPDSQVNASKSSFTSHYLETELDGERVGLTLWDSAGLEKHLIDLQLRETAAFVESKFEETFLEEQKVNRSPGAKDTHIHCVFFLLEPNKLDNNVAAARNGKPATSAAEVLEVLDDEMDLQVIRALWGKTTVIPVISKADTLTASHMAFLKKSIWKGLKAHNLDPIEALELEEDDEEEDYDDEVSDVPNRRKNGNLNSLDEETTDDSDEIDDNDTPLPSKPHSQRNSHNRVSSLATDPNNDETPYIPMSFLSPDLYDLPPYVPFPKTTLSKGQQQIGRRFAWGFADPYDPEHCDFVRLKESIFGEWRQELRDLSRTKWYENWRTTRLRDLPGKKMRVRGGVTPTAAVPREGRMGSREVVPGVGRVSSAGAGGEAIPRSVSGSTAVGSAVGGAGIGMADGGMGSGQEQRGLSKAERMMGIGAGEAQTLPSRGGTYRGVDSYQ